MSAYRELLELAAKAAGLPYIKPLPGYSGSLGLEVGSDNPMRCWTWNPLTDDGDALRLAGACRLTVCTDGDETVSASQAWMPKTGVLVTQLVSECSDKQAAIRRAIVRAAAEIGRGIA